MKIIIFAGGVGKRLWPLSRKDMPKQFQKLFGEETSLENSYKTIKGAFDEKDIYVSTGEQFGEYVFEVIPELPKENLILEPESKDTGPAVAFAMAQIAAKFPDEPVVIRWQNSLIKDAETFTDTLNSANKLFESGEAELVYLGVPAKYASTTVGYIELDHRVQKTGSDAIYDFAGFKEKPNLSTAKHYIKEGNYVWNPGCYITTPKFMLEKLEQYSSQFFADFTPVLDALQKNDSKKLAESFAELEKISIDYLLWEKLKNEQIRVVVSDYDWHYVSTWTDLRRALQQEPQENITRGITVTEKTRDSLIYNYNSEKLVAVFGLDNVNVIDTPEATLVCDGNEAAKLKELLAKIGEEDSLKNYL